MDQIISFLAELEKCPSKTQKDGEYLEDKSKSVKL